MAMTEEDLARDLEDFDVDGDHLPDVDDELAPVTDEETARKYLRWLRGVSRDRERIKATADAEVRRIRAWADDRIAGLGRREDSLKRTLEGWTRAHLAGSKRKSVATPYGTLKLTAPRTRVEVDDEESFVAWCQDNGREDLLKLAPSKSAVDDALRLGTLAAGPPVEAQVEDITKTLLVADDGVAVPGISLVTPQHDSFSVTLTD